MRIGSGQLAILSGVLVANVAMAQTPPSHAIPEALRALAMVEHLPKKGESGPVSWSTGAYVYDGAGNVAAIGSRAITYDSQSRLRQYIPGGLLATQTYDYDEYGNQVANTIHGPIGVSGPTNHLTDGLVVYDVAGNLAQWQPQGAPALQQYNYDAFSMLQELKVAGAVKRRYIYTSDDERVRIDMPASSLTHWTVRSFDRAVLRDVQLQGTTFSLARDFIHRKGKLLASVTPTRVENDSLDHLGTPRLVTDQGGVEIGYHEYYPFGVEAFPAGTIADGGTRKFTGHERDADPQGGTNDVDYMHARFYDPGLARFLSVDRGVATQRAPASWNRYAYSLDSPLKAVDPDGNRPALLYGKTWDVEPGYGVVLQDNAGNVHVSVVVGFAKTPGGGVVHALVDENAPVEIHPGVIIQDKVAHDIKPVDSNSPSAGGTRNWNLNKDHVVGVVPNEHVPDNPMNFTIDHFTEQEVKDKTSGMSAQYNNQNGGQLGLVCDCAGLANQIMLSLGGTFQPFTLFGDPYDTTDWLDAAKGQPLPETENDDDDDEPK